jgi:hypothetical protein
MSLRFAVAVLLALGCGAAAWGAGAPPRLKGSWADSRHIWATHEDLREPAACGHLVLVCGTEDGGQTWHPLFYGGQGARPVRTSPTAGFLSMFVQADANVWAHFVTTDAGRHWYETRLLPRRFFQVAGHGQFLYWHRTDADTIYRVTPWPPRRSPACPGPWRHANEEWGRVCPQAHVPLGLRNSVAFRFAQRYVEDSGSIPQGFAALLGPIRSRRPEVLVVRSGRARRVRLPRGRVPFSTLTVDRYDLHVAWPTLIVTAHAELPGRRNPAACVFWSSTNGGRTWRSYHTRNWQAPFCGG